MATTTTAATTTATAAATAATQATKSSSGGFGADFNTFLTLLTTQLKNQDPTKAMTPEEMTSQLVQFAQVEQQVKVNTSLQTLVGLRQTAQLTAAAPLLGQQVEVESDRLALQDGTATLRLPAAGAATEATVSILDSAGRTLREVRLPLNQAAMTWTWDGRDAAGRRLPDGAYGFVVQGSDGNGGAQPVSATVRARATGAERAAGSGDLRLQLGPGLGVGFDKVRSLPGTSGG